MEGTLQLLTSQNYQQVINHSLTLKDAYVLAAQASKRSFPHATRPVASLYPVYLPYMTQHKLLVKVQTA